MDLWTGLWNVVGVIGIINYFVYQRLAAAKFVSLNFALKPILYVITSPLMILAMPIFLIYRQIVNVILAQKHGAKYGGLIEGRDSVYNLENKNPAYILILVKYPSNRSKCFYDAIKDAMSKSLKSSQNPKIFGALKTFFGYSYILKDEISLNNCLKKIETKNTPMTRNDVLDFLHKCCTIDLPKNREGFWDLFIGTQPVLWWDDDEEDKMEYYPLIWRINHTFADGMHAFYGVNKLFSDNTDGKQKATSHHPAHSKQRRDKSFLHVGQAMLFCLKEVFYMFLTVSVGLVNTLLMENDCNALHGPKLTCNRMFFVNDEKVTHYIPILKRIRRQIPNCSFEDIIHACVSASLKEYFEKNSSLVPEYIVAETPAVPPSLIKFTKPKSGEMLCRNRLTFLSRRFPINFDTKNTKQPLSDVLKGMVAQGKILKSCFELEVNYFILTVACHIFPAQILRPVIEMFHRTTLLINAFPGPTPFTVLDGCPVKLCCPWVTARGYTGVGFSFCTYEDRLQASLIVDKALVSNKIQIANLLDNFYKYVDQLDEELKNVLDNTIQS